MITLAEVESAVNTLPRPEQEALLQHLARRLIGSVPDLRTGSEEMPQRQHWLAELRQMRERNVTAHSGAALQNVMDDLRSERN